jgi:hypothetical protein
LGRVHQAGELGLNALDAHDFQAVGLLANGVFGGGIQREAELHGKSHGAQHAQRVFVEGFARVARRAQEFRLAGRASLYPVGRRFRLCAGSPAAC